MKNPATPRIAHVIFRLDYGGLENGLVNLVNRMPADRYRHDIVCLAGFGEEFRSRIQRDDVAVISIDKRPGKDPAAYGRMWRTLRQLRPNIMHTRNLGTIDMQWIAAAAGVKYRVHGEHGWEASDPRGQNPHNLRIRRACRPLIHRYVPMSRDIAAWLENDVGVPPSRIRQVYSGVDTDRFRPGARTGHNAGHPVTAADKDLRKPGPGVVRLGTVGRLDPVKNHGYLLKAMRSILDRRRDLEGAIELIIVGDGPLRGELESAIRELRLESHVRLAGASNEIPRIIGSFDVFVLPSLNEGISNTILEAMATGLPVVAADVGGNAELIVHGVTGALYEHLGPAALEETLLQYLDDPGLRRSHGEAGRLRVLDRFSMNAMIQRYLNLYDEFPCAA